jgi:hypothetical protein
MIKEGNLYKVPCEVNGLKLNFYFDTGASVVSLSSSVADFMLRNGYLNPEDIFDEATMRQADGSLYKSRKVRIKSLNIGGLFLYNTIGIIVPHQDSPLLLGQSAIQKLGKISIHGNFLYIDKPEKVEYKGQEKDISFLGLKQGTHYNECYDKLLEKYGEEYIIAGETNGIDYLRVDNMMFNNVIYDRITLYFDSNYLNSVNLEIYFSKKEVSKIARKVDEIYKLYAKKYTAISKESRNGFASYSMGYIKRTKDTIKYPISLGVVDTTFQDFIDGEWHIDNYFAVSLLYWPASYNILYDNHPPQEDEY